MPEEMQQHEIFAEKVGQLYKCLNTRIRNGQTRLLAPADMEILRKVMIEITADNLPQMIGRCTDVISRVATLPVESMSETSESLWQVAVLLNELHKLRFSEVQEPFASVLNERFLYLGYMHRIIARFMNNPGGD